MCNEKNITSVASSPSIMQLNFMKYRLWVEGKLDQLEELDNDFKKRNGALIGSPRSGAGEVSPT